MPSSILVTGATGFAGSHLLDRIAGKVTVAGWYRPGGHPPDRSRPVEWHAVDLLDRNAVEENIERVAPAQIYHLAGAPLVGVSSATVVPQLRANALGTHHLLEAVRQTDATCRVLVVTSAQI